jgi:putative Mn2+ efflux pump MntP
MKVLIFGAIAGRYVGVTKELFIGIALFSLPLAMGIFKDKYPKSKSLQKWLPIGIIEMLVMTLGGYFLALSIQDRYPDARTYVLASFVLLSVPGFLLKILNLFGEDGADDWKITKYGVIAYRVLGVVALAILLYIVLSGVLVTSSE